jgi:hypothetical protein|tara:strand:+ start:9146 stop:9391 length:246 start_codon:yes stop_codon:yes gene_type:complete
MRVEETTDETYKALLSIKRSINSLNKQIKIIQKQFPNAQYYHSDSTIYVTADETHASNGTPNQGENILSGTALTPSDGGGW